MSATSRPGFLGYRRPDGRVGVRNHLLVVPTVMCSSVVAERVAAAVAPIGTALPHTGGCGQLGPDRDATHETLAAYCGHPNVGAVLVIALGCEQVVAQHLADSELVYGWRLRLIGAGTLSKRTRNSPPAFNEIGVEGDRFETLVRTMSAQPVYPISEMSAAGR